MKNLVRPAGREAQGLKRSSQTGAGGNPLTSKIFAAVGGLKKSSVRLVHPLRPFSINTSRNMKHRNHLSITIAVAILSPCLSLTAQTMPRKSSSPSASPTPTASVAASQAKQASRPFPFHGMVLAVDQKAKTFTIAGKQNSRAFKVTDKTTVTKSGNTASMSDIVENEEVSGSYWKHADGTVEAKVVKLGPMEKAKTSAPSATPEDKPSASPKP
jgi:hypothetical protein